MCKITDWLVCGMLFLCGIYDWRKKELPVWWLVCMSVIVGIFLLCFHRNMLWSRVAGVILGIVLFLFAKWTKEMIGYGDCWLILLLGIYIGIYQSLCVLFIASAIAGIFALFCLWFRKWNKKMSIPFVPFLAVAYLGVVCL